MSWVTTEAVKNKNKELILGESLSAFMRELNLIPTGGRWGSITRLKEQMKKLLSASISCTYDDGKNWKISNIQPIEQADLWWDTKQANQISIWQSKLILNDNFFKEVITNPIPVDMRVLKALKRSPMALDIYCWLTYRMSYLKKETQIPWAMLQNQFGSGYAQNSHGVRNFKIAFLRELKKVHQFYPSAKINSEKYSLVLKPSLSHISKNFEETLAKNTNNKDFKSETFVTELHELYRKYQYVRLAEIIENELDKKQKNTLLNEFDNYLKRSQVKNIKHYQLHNPIIQKWLYRFVDNYWHYLIEQIESFDKFIKNKSPYIKTNSF